MANYLIIESREPDDTFADASFTDWVCQLRQMGHPTTVFLTQNAVIAARKGCVFNEQLTTLLESKVTVLVDEFYATEKSIDVFNDGVEPSDMDRLVDQIMSESTRTIWH